ncbi:rCG28934, partial [Rattus norvegicus]
FLPIFSILLSIPLQTTEGCRTPRLRQQEKKFICIHVFDLEFAVQYFSGCKKANKQIYWG